MSAAEVAVGDAPGEGDRAVRPVGTLRAAGRRFAGHRLAVAAAAVLAVIVAYCLLVPLLWPHDTTTVDFTQKLEGPSWSHPLGTDFFGRDLVARMAEGGRTSLLIAASAAVVILVVGFVYGGISGLAGGRVDEIMMRVLDGLFAVPRFPVQVILLVIAGGTGNWLTLVGALAILSWMTTARLVRGQVMSLKQQDYVRAARAAGAGSPRILLRHLAPNTLGVLIVALFLELPGVIVGEAYVSVLGLGLEPPAASWGNIAYDGLGLQRSGSSVSLTARYGLSLGQPWLVILPSLAIGIVALCANYVADGLQDALDPRRATFRPRRRRLFGLLRPAAARSR